MGSLQCIWKLKGNEHAGHLEHLQKQRKYIICRAISSPAPCTGETQFDCLSDKRFEGCQESQESLMADVQNHYVFQRFCMILTGAFAWSIHHPGVVFLTSWFSLFTDVQDHYVFQWFTRFCWIRVVSRHFPSGGPACCCQICRIIVFSNSFA